ncbi:SufE family protein [Algicola sagamiensis]|uniref:SufE family protein n=1 Tax=Algicola sagamiensis TaxID=163869 RepID=UPI00038070EE|nr:SufE family protein [Algicola sagamiensis]
MNNFESTLSYAELLDLFEKAKGWEEKYRQIMLLGKQLKRPDGSLLIEANQVEGCESQVWMVIQKQENTLNIIAYSDSKIVRGLVGLLLIAIRELKLEEIAVFDAEAFFQTLKLESHLSPSRTNGLKSLIDHMIAAAKNEI